MDVWVVVNLELVTQKGLSVQKLNSSASDFVVHMFRQNFFMGVSQRVTRVRLVRNFTNHVSILGLSDPLHLITYFDEILRLLVVYYFLGVPKFVDLEVVHEKAKEYGEVTSSKSLHLP
jgi:hypothetical protein